MRLLNGISHLRQAGSQHGHLIYEIAHGTAVLRVTRAVARQVQARAGVSGEVPASLFEVTVAGSGFAAPCQSQRQGFCCDRTAWIILHASLSSPFPDAVIPLLPRNARAYISIRTYVRMRG